MGLEAGTRRKAVATLRPDGREEALPCVPLSTDPACYLCSPHLEPRGCPKPYWLTSKQVRGQSRQSKNQKTPYL